MSRIKIEGGFISAKKEESGKIGMAIGCDHYNSDGTRRESVINTAMVTEEEIVALFRDVFPQEDSIVEESLDESNDLTKKKRRAK